MKVKGIHHVSALTADAQKNLDFYRNILGLKLVKKSVNQDEPTMYHLFYGDETANPGSELTFSKFRGLRRFMREQTVFLQSACVSRMHKRFNIGKNDLKSIRSLMATS